MNLIEFPSNEYLLKNRDLIFVRSNGNKELIGRCLVIYPNDNKVTFSGFCIRFRPTANTINTVYLSHLFRIPVFRAVMLQGGKGANIQNLNQKTLERLKIPMPSIELQNQFEQIVEKTEALKTQYQQSLQELENLYGSLSQKAFKGELKQ
ncbi:MAG: restriction endonuclease subunit S [Cyclobacteriaceae bacterium]|nr:MAG: restriction endonuclease subunit S [Cyclobacteriaceae bacterium]